MKNIFSSMTFLMVSTGLLIVSIINPVHAQGLSLEEIRLNLINNPPNTGDPALREQTILALDEILKNDSSRTSPQVINFYGLMMDKVNTELEDTLSAGVSIWMMYNHGFVIKTPQDVFAFDLVDGYSAWPINLPPQLISQIKVLFISHSHSDHYDYSVASAVMANGGFVVVPSENSNLGNVSMAPGESVMLLGLQIKAHNGLHSVPVRIYEVSTPDGIKILHTGDNQTSTTLPQVDSLDVLLLNAWVDESGYTSAVIGMRNCIYSVTPELMIPGHIQELGHDYDPSDPATRVPYEWAFEVDDVPLPADVQVMAWGERFFIPGGSVGITEHSEGSAPPVSFTLEQNYPNPFNPTTTIEFSIPKSAFVTLKIYNVLGEEVATLVSEKLPAGKYKYDWPARSSGGDAGSLASGVYLYRIQAGSYVKAKKMVLMK